MVEIEAAAMLYGTGVTCGTCNALVCKEEKTGKKELIGRIIENDLSKCINNKEQASGRAEILFTAVFLIRKFYEETKCYFCICYSRVSFESCLNVSQPVLQFKLKMPFILQMK